MARLTYICIRVLLLVSFMGMLAFSWTAAQDAPSDSTEVNAAEMIIPPEGDGLDDVPPDEKDSLFDAATSIASSP